MCNHQIFNASEPFWFMYFKLQGMITTCKCLVDVTFTALKICSESLIIET